MLLGRVAVIIPWNNTFEIPQTCSASLVGALTQNDPDEAQHCIRVDPTGKNTFIEVQPYTIHRARPAIQFRELNM